MDSVYHIPAMLKETIDGLNIKSEGVYVDVTFGGGGHSRAILERMAELEDSKIQRFQNSKLKITATSIRSTRTKMLCGMR